ncbi:hypothetical protein [Longitalea luteola]|uniref:hypothetical protein n=1 Tax=Longitalea luteola TaxID=2812563 RepID=UPI001A95B492|nr:hypothetical protein [Longitalea luteola]
MISIGRIKYGEASKLRTLKSGKVYDHLFEKAPGKVYTIKKNAGLQDTVQFIPQVVRQTLNQTKGIAQDLKKDSVYETCKNIWQFVYDHVQYRKDQHGYEQIRSPRRTWHDRTQGVDCDCYSVLISSILTNLEIPHILRITKYNQNHFQHIYPVVPHKGQYITIDCVTDHFDYEVPYSQKKDYNMELQFLDGLPNYEADGMGELGRLFKKKNKTGNISASAPAQKKGLLSKILKKKPTSPASSGSSAPAPKKKKKGLFKKIGSAVKKVNLKKVVSKINKINPVTIALRNGILAAMKLNVKNVAKRLRYSYLTKEQAEAKGIEGTKYDRLLKIRQKLESIFETGGGKVSNLKKAILSGKGNKDKQVLAGLEGLGALSMYDTDNLNIYTPLEQLLGTEVYYEENVAGLEGLGELGEPVTLATVGAAMGVLTGIIASLQELGNIFKGKQPGSEDFDKATNEAAENNQPVPDTTPVPASATPTILPEPVAVPSPVSYEATPVTANYESAASSIAPETARQEPIEPEEESYSETAEENASVITTQQNTSPAKPANNTPADKASFWEKNKTWLKPTAVIGGSILLIAVCASVLNNGQAKNKSSPDASLSGLPTRKKKHKKVKRKQAKKVAIELL